MNFYDDLFGSEAAVNQVFFDKKGRKVITKKNPHPSITDEDFHYCVGCRGCRYYHLNSTYDYTGVDCGREYPVENDLACGENMCDMYNIIFVEIKEESEEQTLDSEQSITCDPR